MKKLYIIILLIFLNIFVLNAKWEKCFGIEVKNITCTEFSGNTLYVGTIQGLYILEHNGDTWIEKRTQFTNNAIRAISAKENEVYIGFSDALYYSDNYGENWIKTNFNVSQAGKNIHSLLVYNDDIYIGTSSQGIIVSYDKGENWISKNNGLPSGNLNTVISLAMNDNIFVACFQENGVYVSTDNGENWELSGTFDINLVSAVISNDNIILATQNQGLFISSDYGQTWSFSGFKPFSYFSEYITSFAANENNLYFGTISRTIYHSSNSGKNWKLVNDFGNIDGIVGAIAINKNEVFVGVNGLSSNSTSKGIYYSDNFGKDFSQSGFTPHKIGSMCVENNNVIIGSDKGVYLSTDYGDSWKITTLKNEYCNMLAKSKDIIYCGGSTNVYKTTDNGRSWFKIRKGLPSNNYYNILYVNNEDIFLGQGKGYSHSRNGGLIWNEHPFKNTVYSYSFKDSLIFMGTHMQIFVSSDNGESWHESEIFKELPISIFVEQVENTYYAIGNEGIYYTNNNGLNWEIRNKGLTYSLISNLRIHTNNDYVFLTTGSSVFFIDMQSSEWSSLSNERLKELNINQIHLLGTNEKYLYAASKERGVIRIKLSDIIESEVSVNENEYTKKDIILYPNPAYDYIEIKTNNEYIDDIQLFNILGEMVFNKNVKNYGSYKINIMHLPNGIYFLKIEGQIKVFIKQ